jgi:hypothetical protein
VVMPSELGGRGVKMGVEVGRGTLLTVLTLWLPACNNHSTVLTLWLRNRSTVLTLWLRNHSLPSRPSGDWHEASRTGSLQWRGARRRPGVRA